MKIRFKMIEKTESDSLASWLSSDTWPFFLENKPSRDEVLKRIEVEGAFFGVGELNFWILDAGPSSGSGSVPQNAPSPALESEPVLQTIGLIELYQLDDLAPMFSVRFKTDFRGQGLGAQAVSWLTRYVFENHPDKRRIEAQTREDNVAMRKILNRCGYVKEAYYRFASPTEDGGRVASIAYGILREDWQSGTTTPVKWEADHYFCGDKL